MKRNGRWLALFVLVVTALPVAAQGNPFLGTWKLNTAKSKFVPGPGPQSLTRTVTASGNGVKYSFAGESADGKAFGYSFVTYYDKTNAAITGTGIPGGADAISLKKVNPYKAEGTMWKGGHEVGKVVAEVSKDGMVTTVKVKGPEVNSETVYDKQ